VIDVLYSDRILRLAANMPRAGRLAQPDGSAERTAKLCGSRVTADVVVRDGRVADFGQDVQACALGQASAAVLGANVVGATVEEVALARTALREMLKRGGPAPEGRFADLAVLAAVREYPARHASTLLAFDAALAAIEAAAEAACASAV
jgi:NifU-like protein involved in Fe-S cluster formation